MREIKFRGRAISTGEWVYSTEPDHKDLVWARAISTGKWVCSTEPDHKDLVWAMRNFWDNVYHRGIDPATVGQWTGLNDCDGTEIYEGDIVEYNIGCSDSNNPSGVIEFHIGQFFINRDSNLITIDDTTNVEVIGNIHETGESK